MDGIIFLVNCWCCCQTVKYNAMWCTMCNIFLSKSVDISVQWCVWCIHKCREQGGQSGSEISYLFLRVVNITSVLLKKLPYGPLCHLPTEPMRKNPTLKTGNWNFRTIMFCKMQFVILQSDTISTNVMSKSPKKNWNFWMQLFWGCMEVMNNGAVQWGGRTGKNGSCMTWSVASGSRPSFHTDPVHLPQCTAVHC